MTGGGRGEAVSGTGSDSIPSAGSGAGSGSAPLLVLFLVNALNIFDRQALGAVLEPLRHEFGLSDTQLGALPTVFTIVYALAGLPLARLADTGSRRKLLAAGVGVWASLTALGGFAANYWMLLATRLGVGIGEAVCAPTATSWIGDLVPPARRARAMAGFMMAVPVGVMLSFAITGPAAQACGWRAALALGALPAVVLIPALLRLEGRPAARWPARERRRERCRERGRERCWTTPKFAAGAVPRALAGW